ncbi:hypothetical protein KOR42_52280 [Thalassoglobus neptunius]|uniref:Uncharacterized protein n=1 Tax=Thalassoglobus neptunius TaxID=1938619 RepID=A0A5C5VAQ2_9PLAN|nr:hypothetical protein [Thalassoglobus neptunius]TWT35080.1 hypothetical protein KOR42_52280 [Thalassoglobus neptunius]
MHDPHSHPSPIETPLPRRQISLQCRPVVNRFVQQLKTDLDDNLVAAAVYGPAVTEIFDLRYHRVHVLIVTQTRDVDRLIALGASSDRAIQQGIAPPLILTEKALKASFDVFPLEWLDIHQFHVNLVGVDHLASVTFNPSDVRLQCERDLRTLDIQIQRGILASRGNRKRVERIEDASQDTLVRILRGIAWLTGDRNAYLPLPLVDHCEVLLDKPLPGCRQSVDHEGRHDLQTLGQLLDELGHLAGWIDVV